jgi:light-regulated signal transduction histidine kinase (bacteriophytochrome)
MGQLIDDMLKLSRVSRAELKFQRINLTEMAKNVMERIKENQKYPICEMQIQPGLFCSGDSQLVEIALTNLLENACKFSATRENPKVEFGLTKMDGKSAYFVRDNGVGFDMAFTQKLFGAFQRLHAQTEFPGTGIGLATVQRIIHRHGGTIWADAQLDAGASFYFTLPEAAGE